jgi:hypothetical protein
MKDTNISEKERFREKERSIDKVLFPGRSEGRIGEDQTNSSK